MTIEQELAVPPSQLEALIQQDIQILLERMRRTSKTSRMFEMEMFLSKMGSLPGEYILAMHRLVLQQITQLEHEGNTGRQRHSEHTQLYSLLKDIYGPLCLARDRLVLPDK